MKRAYMRLEYESGGAYPVRITVSRSQGYEPASMMLASLSNVVHHAAVSRNNIQALYEMLGEVLKDWQ